jgi:hypothetical protein
MSGKSWLQRNHEALLNQANLTVNYLTAENLTRIGIAGEALSWYNSVFIVKHGIFAAAFAGWQNPAERSAVKIAVLKEAEKQFIEVYRKLYVGYLKGNPLVTDADLVEMGLPKRHSGGNTPPPVPNTLVEATIDTSIPACIKINYRDMNEKGTAKPKGVHGVEIAWVISDTHPVDWAQLTNSSFDTRTPAQLVFSGEQRGHTVFFALRWENTRGEKGPWGEIYSAIIP